MDGPERGSREGVTPAKDARGCREACAGKNCTDKTYLRCAGEIQILGAGVWAGKGDHAMPFSRRAPLGEVLPCAIGQ